MNQIAKSVKSPEQPNQPNQLPIEALNLAFNALIAKSGLEEITSRIHSADKLVNALDRVRWDSKYSRLDVPAAIAKLNDLRAQFIPDTVALDDILNKPATKAQVKSLAGAVPKIFGKTDATHVDFWLAAVFDLLATKSISAVVMVKAIRALLGESKFMPAPCEFCEACYDVRHDVRRLRDEIVRLAALPPPRLPELPKPEIDQDMIDLANRENAAMPDPWGRTPEEFAAERLKNEAERNKPYEPLEHSSYSHEKPRYSK